MRSRTLAIATLIGLALSAVPLSVPAARAADDSVTVIARQRFKEGVALFDKGKFEEARVAFVQAYALKKHPVVLLNLAQSELKSGHPVAAARHFSQFLRENKDAKPAEIKLATDGLKEARNKTARIRLQVDIPFAEVLIDGESVGQTPLPEAVDVNPGENHVEVKTSAESKSATVTTTVQQIVPVSILFKQDEASATVSTNEGNAQASLSIGEDSGNEHGNERESFVSWMKRDPIAWGGAGVTLLGAGLGIGFAVAYGQAQSNADSIAQTIKDSSSIDSELVNYENSGMNRQANPCADPVPVTHNGDYRDACAKLKDNLDKKNSNKVLAWLGRGLFIADAATTTIMYFIRTDPDAKKPDESSAKKSSGVHASVAPVISPTWQGLTIGGTF